MIQMKITYQSRYLYIKYKQSSATFKTFTYNKLLTCNIDAQYMWKYVT